MTASGDSEMRKNSHIWSDYRKDKHFCIVTLMIDAMMIPISTSSNHFMILILLRFEAFSSSLPLHYYYKFKK